MDRRGIESQWLEPVLKEHLGRVRAPEALWYRIQAPRVVKAEGSGRQLAWTAAVTLAVMTIAWGLHARRDGFAADQAFAIRALAQGSADIEFRCNEPGRIREWVKARTGLDIPLPAEGSAGVQLIGAHVAQAGGPMAEVAYRVGNRDALLVCSRAESGQGEARGHRFQDGNGRRVSSWIMRGQRYTLACAEPDALQAACMLCHASGSGQTALN